MSELVEQCPRCQATKITFDARAVNSLEGSGPPIFETFCVCRACGLSTVFLLTQKRGIGVAPKPNGPGCLNGMFNSKGFVCVKNYVEERPPEHVPENIKAAFDEGATCMAVNCFNAGATMFRLCIDHATKPLLPAQDVEGLNSRIRWSLGHRLKWLFDTKRLPETLRELAACIKEDGNDGAHEGSLTKVEAEDLLDFTRLLLERLYTEPERLKLAAQRREARRTPAA